MKSEYSNNTAYNPADAGKPINYQPQDALVISNDAQMKSDKAIKTLIETTRNGLKDASYVEKCNIYG